MNAVERMRPKLSSCAAACRGFWRPDNIVSFSFLLLGCRAVYSRRSSNRYW